MAAPGDRVDQLIKKEKEYWKELKIVLEALKGQVVKVKTDGLWEKVDRVQIIF